MKNILRGLGTAAAAGVMVLAVAAPALAHPTVVSRTPEDGSTVGQPPSEVKVEFDEVVKEARLEVFDPCGTQVDDGNSEIFLKTVTVGMSADKAGTYSVEWEVISDDGHNVGGDWSFTSSGGSACPGSGGGSGSGGGGNGGGGTGGSGGGSGGTGGGSTGGTSGGGGTSAGGGGNGSSSGGAGGKHNHNGESGGGNNKHSTHHHHTTPEETKEVDLAAAGDEPTSDIPWDWLLISFAIAALIGAAGGSIYSSIIGPR